MIFMTFLWALLLCGRLHGNLRGMGLCRGETSVVGRLPVSGEAWQSVVVTLVT